MVLYAVSEMEIHVLKKTHNCCLGATLFPAVPTLPPRVQGFWGVIFHACILTTA